MNYRTLFTVWRVVIISAVTFVALYYKPSLAWLYLVVALYVSFETFYILAKTRDNQ